MGGKPCTELEKQEQSVELMAKENIPYNVAIRKVKGIAINKQIYVCAQYSSIVQKETAPRNENNKNQGNLDYNNQHQKRMIL